MHLIPQQERRRACTVYFFNSFSVAAQALIGAFFLITLLHSHSSFAAGFYLQELGTPSSIGTAGTARTTNHYGAETAWGNPAGMTGLTKDTLLIGGQVLVPNIRFDSDIAQAGGSDGGNAGDVVVIPSVFAVKSISDKARLGFSIVAPLGGGVDYGSDFVGRYSAQEAALSGLAVSPSFGYQVNDDLSIGAGVSFIYTLFEMDIAVNQPGALPDGKVKIEDVDDWGHQFFLGMQYQLNDKTRLGLVYRSEAEIDLSGDFKIKDTILPITPSGRVKAGWDNPQLIEVGLSFEVDDNMTIFLQADWEDWSVFSKNTFQVSGGGGLGLTTVANLDRDFKDTYRLGVGMAYKAGEKKYLLGTSYDSSPVSDSNRTFDLPLDEQFRIAGAIIHESEQGLDYALSASFVYFGEGKVDQTSQGVRVKGEFDKNWGIFLGTTLKYEF
ncbi:MAG: outer membrane protein transport protein [Gammaproteobacteria bacterium]|nr:outer membrane protein transport protein [Gammaproteobacteria bacterium]